MSIARLTAELPQGLSWDDLLWEDGASIIQAIFETSILTSGGEGLAGKIMGVFIPLLEGVARQSLPKPNGKGSKSPASPSSPTDGGPTPKA